jgi:hypothetical protein
VRAQGGRSEGRCRSHQGCTACHCTCTGLHWHCTALARGCTPRARTQSITEHRVSHRQRCRRKTHPGAARPLARGRALGHRPWPSLSTLDPSLSPIWDASQAITHLCLFLLVVADVLHPDRLPSDLGPTQVVDRKVSAPLVFIRHKRKAHRLRAHAQTHARSVKWCAHTHARTQGLRTRACAGMLRIRMPDRSPGLPILVAHSSEGWRTRVHHAGAMQRMHAPCAAPFQSSCCGTG